MFGRTNCSGMDSPCLDYSTWISPSGSDGEVGLA